MTNQDDRDLDLLDDDDFPRSPNGLIESSREQKRPYEMVWDVCLQFLEGDQDSKRSSDIQNVAQSGARTAKKDADLLYINKMLPLYRTTLSQLETNYPAAVVMPASPSQEDIVKAQSSEEALRYQWAEDKLKTTWGTVCEWLIPTGNAGVMTMLDDRRKVTTIPLSPYDMFYEPGVRSERESDWVAVRSLTTKRELHRAYPDQRDKIDEAIEPSDEVSHAPRAQSLRIPKGRLEIFEWQFRDGRTGISLGEHWLQKGELPGERVTIHLVKYTALPNRLWGLGLLQPLLALQDYLNKCRTQILRNVKMIGSPKLLWPSTAGNGHTAWTNAEAGIVPFKPQGGPPIPFTPPGIPGWVLDNIRQIESEILDSAGIHSISLGKRAVGITSGKAIEALAQKDASQLLVTQQAIEEAAALVSTDILTYMKEFYTETRFARMMDGLGKVIFAELNATSIVDDPEIHIEAGSLFRREAQDRDAKLMALLEAQLATPDEVREGLSWRMNNRRTLLDLIDRAHALDVLNVAKQAPIAGIEEVAQFVNGPDGAPIENPFAIKGVVINKRDNLKVFQQVFQEFVRDPSFYDLSPDRQNYIADILTSIEETQAELAQNPDDRNGNAFPRQSAPDEATRELVLMQSPVAQAQAMASTTENARLATETMRAEKDVESVYAARQGGTG